MNAIKQPSTWAGIAGFATLFAQSFPQYAAFAHLFSALGSGLAVFLNETGAAK